MEIIITFLLLVVPLAIASATGRAGIAVLVTTLIFVLVFTILNMGGGHFVEALEFALGLSMYVAVFSSLGAYVGAKAYSKSAGNKANPENPRSTTDDQ